MAAELAGPGTPTPSWGPSEWLIARAVAAMHGVSPLLAGVLRWDHPPQEWVAFLAGQRRHTAARLTRIHQLLSELDAESRQEGIALVALKGAELHALNLYAPGERPMSDIDLLSREQDRERTAQLLVRMGFQRTMATARHLVFEPQQRRAPAKLGEDSTNDIKIELHGGISERLPLAQVDITESVFPHRPQAGLNRYPSTAALMKHLLLHAAGATVVRAVRLLHLNDISRLATRMSAGDWAEVLRGSRTAAATPSRAWWAFPPLQLAARYFSCVPTWVLEEAERSCPRPLARAYKRKRLSDVSYTYLWIDAFPGMEWAVSTRTKLRYALQRIRPEREMLQARAALLQSEPRNAGSEWARLSQSRRILRWLTSSPVRVETITAVRAALGQWQ